MLEKSTEILAILNSFKDTLKDFVNNLDIEPIIISKLVSKRPCNIMTDLENPSNESEFDNLTKPKLDKDFLNGSCW